MQQNHKRAGAASLLAVFGFLVLGAASCGDKANEPFRDAPRTSVTNSTAADIITMPDGFSNMSTKCDHGNRVYSAYHGNSPYSSIQVVPNDPTCK